MAVFQVSPRQPQNVSPDGLPGCGFEPTVKMLSLHRLAGDIFERGRSFFKFKIKICMVFVFKKKPRPRSKRRRGSGAKPRGFLRGLKPELREPRSGGVCGYHVGT